MPASYDDARDELYRAAFESFVAERKRLAAELKAGGDAVAAARLGKLTRPSISAWIVNQLYWKERAAFDELFRAAARLREVELDAAATAEHREALGVLRTRAMALLSEAGKSASESLLRRVATTLSALAAVGNFDPDRPGALSADRDPPGFEVASSLPMAPARKVEAPVEKGKLEAERARKAEAEAERRRQELEQAQRRAERERLERRLRLARSELETRSDELSEIKRRQAAAEELVERAREAVAELEAELEKVPES